MEKEWAAAKDVPIVVDSVYTQGDRDFKAQVTVMLEKKPDALSSTPTTPRARSLFARPDSSGTPDRSSPKEQISILSSSSWEGIR